MMALITFHLSSSIGMKLLFVRVNGENAIQIAIRNIPSVIFCNDFCEVIFFWVEFGHKCHLLKVPWYCELFCKLLDMLYFIFLGNKSVMILYNQLWIWCFDFLSCYRRVFAEYRTFHLSFILVDSILSCFHCEKSRVLTDSSEHSTTYPCI